MSLCESGGTAHLSESSVPVGPSHLIQHVLLPFQVLHCVQGLDFEPLQSSNPGVLGLMLSKWEQMFDNSLSRTLAMGVVMSRSAIHPQ